MKDKKKRKKLARGTPVMIIALFLIVMAIAGTTIWSVWATFKNVNEASDELSDFYLSEMMEQSEQVLSDSLTRYYDALSSAIGLMKESRLTDEDALRQFLEQAEILTGTDKIGLVDTEGTVYTDHSTFSDASRYTMLRENFTEPQIIASDIYGAKKTDCNCSSRREYDHRGQAYYSLLYGNQY